MLLSAYQGIPLYIQLDFLGTILYLPHQYHQYHIFIISVTLFPLHSSWSHYHIPKRKQLYFILPDTSLSYPSLFFLSHFSSLLPFYYFPFFSPFISFTFSTPASLFLFLTSFLQSCLLHQNVIFLQANYILIFCSFFSSLYTTPSLSPPFQTVMFLWVNNFSSSPSRKLLVPWHPATTLAAQ